MQRILWTLSILAAILVALIVATPTMLSTQMGNRILLHHLNQSMEGRLTAGHIAIRWGPRQSAREIRLYDPQGMVLFECASLTVDASLWSLLWGSRDLGKVEIAHPQAYVVLHENGYTNWSHTVPHAPQPVTMLRAGPALPPVRKQVPFTPYTGTFIVVSGQATLALPHRPPVEIETLHGLLDIPSSLHGISASASFGCRQADTVGEFKLKANNLGWPIDPLAQSGLELSSRNLPTGLIEAAVLLAAPSLYNLPEALLGPAWNIHFSAEGSLQEGKAAGHLIGGPTSGEFSLKASTGTLSLTTPALLNWQLAPVTAGGLTLTSLTKGRVDLTTLQTTFKGGSFTDPTFQASLQTGPMDFATPAVHFSEVAASLVQTDPSQPLALTFKTSGSSDNRPLDINLTAHLDPRADSLHGNIVAAWNGIPTGLLSLTSPQLPWRELLGPRFSGSVQGAIREHQGMLTLQANSETLVLGPLTMQLNDHLRLLEPARLQLTLSPTLQQQLLPANTPLRATDPVILQIYASEFSTPLQVAFNPSETHFTGSIALSRLAFDGVPHQGKILMDGFRIHFAGESMAHGTFAAYIHPQFPDANGLFGALLPQDLPIVAEGYYHLHPDLTLDLPQAELILDTPGAHLSAALTLQSNQQVQLTQPIEVRYTLTPDIWRHLTRATEVPLLDEPALISLSVAPFGYNLNTNQWRQLPLHAALTLPKAQFSTSLKPELNQFRADITIAPNEELAIIQWQGSTKVEGTQSGSIGGELRLHGTQNLADATLEGNIQLNTIPMSLIEALTNRPNLTTLLGPALSVDISGQFDHLAAMKGRFSALIKSDLLKAQGSFAIDSALSLAEGRPAMLNWTLSPKAFEIFKQRWELPFTLLAPIDFASTLKTLSWPLPGRTVDLGQAAIAFNATLPLAQIDLGDDKVSLSHLALDLEALSLLQPLEVRLKGRLIPSDTSSKINGEGMVAVSAAIDGPITPDGRHNPQAAVTLEGKLTQVSIPAVARLATGNESLAHQLTSAFGQHLSGQVTGQLKDKHGSYACELRTDLAELSCAGNIRANTLTLTQPLKASLQVSPAFGADVLATLNPLLKTAVRAEQPATLQIASEGFSWPLWPFDLQKIAIGRCELNLGRLWLRRQGALTALLALFRNPPLLNEFELQAWTTPIYFSIAKGHFDYQRTDILLGRSLHVATWGGVDLITANVRATLGIPGAAIKALLSSESIDEKAWLLLPIRGTGSDAGIDWKQAALRLTALAVPKESLGTLGSLIDKAVVGLSAKAPPPTTTPFPWEQP